MKANLLLIPLCDIVSMQENLRTHATKDQISLCLILLRAEIDISVSKLLGFETFANFLRVSVLENFLLEKVSVSVLENLV